MSDVMQSALNAFIEELKNSESLIRLTISTLLLILVVAVSRFLLRRFIRRNIQSSEMRRRWLIQLRNILLIILILGLVVIWGHELRTFALSMVAIAVALVIATKELILCVSGALIKGGARSFNIGDRIQVKEFRGDVIDQNLLTTTILEVGPGKAMQQRSGRLIVLPNSLFASEAVINESYSQDFVLHTFSVPFLRQHKWRPAQEKLLQLAQKYSEPYIDQAKRHFARLSYRTGLEQPVVEPRVTIQLQCAEELHLIVRLPTKEHDRNQTEQAILAEIFADDDYLGDYLPRA